MPNGEIGNDKINLSNKTLVTHDLHIIDHGETHIQLEAQLIKKLEK